MLKDLHRKKKSHTFATPINRYAVDFLFESRFFQPPSAAYFVKIFE